MCRQLQKLLTNSTKDPHTEHKGQTVEIINLLIAAGVFCQSCVTHCDPHCWSMNLPQQNFFLCHNQRSTKCARGICKRPQTPMKEMTIFAHLMWCRYNVSNSQCCNTLSAIGLCFAFHYRMRPQQDAVCLESRGCSPTQNSSCFIKV